jgi:hypothetical protein
MTGSLGRRVDRLTKRRRPPVYPVTEAMLAARAASLDYDTFARVFTEIMGEYVAAMGPEQIAHVFEETEGSNATLAATHPA